VLHTVPCSCPWRRAYGLAGGLLFAVEEPQPRLQKLPNICPCPWQSLDHLISTAPTYTTLLSCRVCCIKAYESAAVGGCASLSGRFPGLSQVLRVGHELQGHGGGYSTVRLALRVSFAQQGRGEYAHLQAGMDQRNSKAWETLTEPGPGLMFNSLTRQYATDSLPAAPELPLARCLFKDDSLDVLETCRRPLLLSQGNHQ
jgi:hypothetical protein